ncbi:hypothetical protein F5Y17DRAFT_122164 [Xylariaceae sp. FL0594]|nr:hypothetical protein F5Y17DRAFT_122164 [Xylariaceae sp. FL0594]
MHIPQEPSPTTNGTFWGGSPIADRGPAVSSPLVWRPPTRKDVQMGVLCIFVMLFLTGVACCVRLGLSRRRAKRARAERRMRRRERRAQTQADVLRAGGFYYPRTHRDPYPLPGLEFASDLDSSDEEAFEMHNVGLRGTVWPRRARALLRPRPPREGRRARRRDREEGLNELGEAPPVYTRVAHNKPQSPQRYRSRYRSRRVRVNERNVDPSVLAALEEYNRSWRLPGYDEVAREPATSPVAEESGGTTRGTASEARTEKGRDTVGEGDREDREEVATGLE